MVWQWLNPIPKSGIWDSSAFIARIKRELGRADTCKAIIDDAKAGRCVLYTSMITLTEVVKLRKGPTQIGKEHEAEIAAFFRNDYIKLVPVDHLIATRARQLIWDYPWLSSRDATHIATAVQIGASVLEHYDDDDIGKVGKRVEAEKLTGFPEIRHPKWTGQIEMALPDVETVASPALNKSTDPTLDSPPAAQSPSVEARPALGGASPEQPS